MGMGVGWWWHILVSLLLTPHSHPTSKNHPPKLQHLPDCIETLQYHISVLVTIPNECHQMPARARARTLTHPHTHTHTPHARTHARTQSRTHAHTRTHARIYIDFATFRHFLADRPRSVHRAGRPDLSSARAQPEKMVETAASVP